MGQRENDTEDLNRQQGVPQLAGFHAQNGGSPHGRAGPRHQVQDTHGQDSNPQQGCRPHVHLLIDRQHRRNNNAEGGSAAAVEVTDQRDDSCHDADTDDVVADQAHELADDDIEHTGIGHDAEVQDGEDEQGSRRAGRREAGLDQGSQVIECVITADNQNQAQDGREENEGNTRESDALEQCDNNCNDTEESEDSYHDF